MLRGFLEMFKTEDSHSSNFIIYQRKVKTKENHNLQSVDSTLCNINVGYIMSFFNKTTFVLQYVTIQTSMDDKTKYRYM